MRKYSRILFSLVTSGCAVLLFNNAIAEDSLRLANSNLQLKSKNVAIEAPLTLDSNINVEADVSKKCAGLTIIHQLKEDIRAQLIKEYNGFENMSISFKPIDRLDMVNNTVRCKLEFELAIEPNKTARVFPIHWECKQRYVMKISPSGTCDFILHSIETVNLLYR